MSMDKVIIYMPGTYQMGAINNYNLKEVVDFVDWHIKQLWPSNRQK